MDKLSKNFSAQQAAVREKYLKEGLLTTLKSQKYEEIIKGNKLFEEELFPHNNSSIFNYSNEENSLHKSKTDIYSYSSKKVKNIC